MSCKGNWETDHIIYVIDGIYPAAGDEPERKKDGSLVQPLDLDDRRLASEIQQAKDAYDKAHPPSDVTVHECEANCLLGAGKKGRPKRENVPYFYVRVKSGTSYLDLSVASHKITIPTIGPCQDKPGKSATKTSKKTSKTRSKRRGM